MAPKINKLCFESEQYPHKVLRQAQNLYISIACIQCFLLLTYQSIFMLKYNFVL